jgi:putative oxidoreductase
MLLNSEPLSEDLGKLLLRITAGGGMIWQHGWNKLMHFGEISEKFGDPIGVGPTVSLGMIVFAETLCAVLVMLGLWTRLSSVPVIIGMAVAAFISNADDPFGAGEKALLYMTAFLVILLVGSGRFSLDRLKFQ